MAKVLLDRLEAKVLSKPVDHDEEELRDDFFECMFLVRLSLRFYECTAVDGEAVGATVGETVGELVGEPVGMLFGARDDVVTAQRRRRRRWYRCGVGRRWRTRRSRCCSVRICCGARAN